MPVEGESGGSAQEAPPIDKMESEKRTTELDMEICIGQRITDDEMVDVSPPPKRSEDQQSIYSVPEHASEVQPPEERTVDMVSSPPEILGCEGPNASQRSYLSIQSFQGADGSPSCTSSNLNIPVAGSSNPRPSALGVGGKSVPRSKTSVVTLLELIADLLEQHEVRLCLRLLDSLCVAEALGRELEYNDAKDVERAIMNFAAKEGASSREEYLLSLVQRVKDGATLDDMKNLRRPKQRDTKRRVNFPDQHRHSRIGEQFGPKGSMLIVEDSSKSKFSAMSNWSRQRPSQIASKRVSVKDPFLAAGSNTPSVTLSKVSKVTPVTPGKAAVRNKWKIAGLAALGNQPASPAAPSNIPPPPPPPLPKEPRKSGFGMRKSRLAPETEVDATPDPAPDTKPDIAVDSGQRHESVEMIGLAIRHSLANPDHVARKSLVTGSSVSSDGQPRKSLRSSKCSDISHSIADDSITEEADEEQCPLSSEDLLAPTLSNNDQVESSSDEDEDEDEDSDLELTELLEDNSNSIHVFEPSGPWIVHPSCNQRLAWDCASLILIIAEAFLLPLDFCFDVEVNIIWVLASTVFFSFDMMSQFSTGYYKDGILVMRQQMIIFHYLRTFFILDLCATVPWDLLFSGGVQGRLARFGKMLRMMRLLRVLRLSTVVERLEDTLPSGTVALLLSSVKMLILFCVVCHWSACIWGYLGQPSKYKDGTFSEEWNDYESCEPGGPCEPGILGSPWVRRYALDGSDRGTHYLVALQFSAGLLLGQNTGIEPGYWAERVYTVIMTIISFIFATSVLSQIVVLLDQMSHETSELNKRLKSAKMFMQSRNVPLVLQAKVRRYLEQEYQIHSSNNQRSNADFLDKLSTWLRLELTFHMHSGTICLHPFFRDLPRPLLQRICFIVEAKLCGPGDVVRHKGEHHTCMCWITSGVLKVFQARKKQKKIPRNDTSTSVSGVELPIAEDLLLYPPSWIGDESLFREVVWMTTVISMEHTELLAFERDFLLQLLHQFPKAALHYKQFQRTLNQGDFVGAGILCGKCGMPGHHLDNCPKMDERGSRMSEHVTAFATGFTQIMRGTQVASFSDGQNGLGFSKAKSGMTEVGGMDEIGVSSDGRIGSIIGMNKTRTNIDEINLKRAKTDNSMARSKTGMEKTISGSDANVLLT